MVKNFLDASRINSVSYVKDIFYNYLKGIKDYMDDRALFLAIVYDGSVPRDQIKSKISNIQFWTSHTSGKIVNNSVVGHADTINLALSWLRLSKLIRDGIMKYNSINLNQNNIKVRDDLKSDTCKLDSDIFYGKCKKPLLFSNFINNFYDDAKKIIALRKDFLDKEIMIDSDRFAKDIEKHKVVANTVKTNTAPVMNGGDYKSKYLKYKKKYLNLSHSMNL